MKTNRNGFTMIEMLVVIVIIGILAGTMFPAVSGFMLNGNLTGMMGNGRKVVQAIIAADMSGRYESITWPSDENADMKPEGGVPTGPDMYQSFSSTAKYFEEALYVKEADVKKRDRLKVLEGIEPSAIAGQGITPASGTTINDNNCAWALAKNISTAPDISPVFVTRNVSTSQLISVAGNDLSSDSETLLNTQKPFGRDGCVLIYKNGSGKKFTAKDVYPAKILEGLGANKLSDFEQGEGSKFEFLSSGKSN